MTDDEASISLSEAAKETMRNVAGVDLEPLEYLGKFVFVAQIGNPQKSVLELRGSAAPYVVGMDVLITGSFVV